MNTDRRVLGIVCIRSGSKGVPNKNIRPLAWKPLVGWILETAQKSKYINRLVVSTDSEEYAAVARIYGAETPYLRPAELATDTAPEFLYVKHMVEYLKEHEGYEPDIVVRMMATVPLQTAEKIEAAEKKMVSAPEAGSAVVIAGEGQHQMKALKIIDDGAIMGTTISGSYPSCSLR